MPEISRFFGIVIRMYFEDHEPPHFHAFYAGSKAQLRIEPIGVLRGDLPPRPLALIVEWASIHRAELLANWDRLRREEPPVRIPPPGVRRAAMHPDVTRVEVIAPYGLRLAFADGTTGFIDGARWVLGKTAGVFAALRDPVEFAKVFVDVEAGTIAWPHEIDIDPDTLYELAHASPESS